MCPTDLGQTRDLKMTQMEVQSPWKKTTNFYTIPTPTIGMALPRGRQYRPKKEKILYKKLQPKNTASSRNECKGHDYIIIILRVTRKLNPNVRHNLVALPNALQPPKLGARTGRIRRGPIPTV